MISGGYSLCKANGQPFSIPMVDGKWPFYFSSAVNPLHLLLEYLWTRLAREYDIGGMWGDDLQIEVPHPFLFAIPDEQQGRLGWHFEYVELTKAELADLGDFEEWEPKCVTVEQAAVIKLLCDGAPMRVDTDDFARFAEESGLDPDQFVRNLIDTHLVGVVDGELRAHLRVLHRGRVRGSVLRRGEQHRPLDPMAAATYGPG